MNIIKAVNSISSSMLSYYSSNSMSNRQHKAPIDAIPEPVLIIFCFAFAIFMFFVIFRDSEQYKKHRYNQQRSKLKSRESPASPPAAPTKPAPAVPPRQSTSNGASGANRVNAAAAPKLDPSGPTPHIQRLAAIYNQTEHGADTPKAPAESSASYGFFTANSINEYTPKEPEDNTVPSAESLQELYALIDEQAAITAPLERDLYTPDAQRTLLKAVVKALPQLCVFCLPGSPGAKLLNANDGGQAYDALWTLSDGLIAFLRPLGFDEIDNCLAGLSFVEALLAWKAFRFYARFRGSDAGFEVILYRLSRLLDKG